MTLRGCASPSLPRQNVKSPGERSAPCERDGAAEVPMDEVCSPVTDGAGLRRKGRGAGSSTVRPGPQRRRLGIPPLFMILFL